MFISYIYNWKEIQKRIAELSAVRQDFDFSDVNDFINDINEYGYVSAPSLIIINDVKDRSIKINKELQKQDSDVNLYLIEHNLAHISEFITDAFEY